MSKRRKRSLDSLVSYHERYFRKLVGKSSDARFHLCACVVDMLASDSYFSIKTSTVDLRAASLTIWVVLALWVTTHQPLDSQCFAELFRHNVKSGIPREVYLVIKNARKAFSDLADQLATWLGVPRSWFFDQPYQPYQPFQSIQTGQTNQTSQSIQTGQSNQSNQTNPSIQTGQSNQTNCAAGVHQVISSLASDVCRLCGMCLEHHLVPDFQTSQAASSRDDNDWDGIVKRRRKSKFGRCDEADAKCNAQQRWETLLAKLHSVRLPVRKASDQADQTDQTDQADQTGKFVTSSMPDVFVQYMSAVFRAQVKAKCAFHAGSCGKMFLVVYTALAALGYQDLVFRRGWVSKSVICLVEPNQCLLSQSAIQPGMMCDLTQTKQYANKFVEQVDKMQDKQRWQSGQLKLLRTPNGALIIKQSKAVINVTIHCDGLGRQDVCFFVDNKQLVLIDATFRTNQTNQTDQTNQTNQIKQQISRFRFFLPDVKAGHTKLVVKNVLLKVQLGDKNSKFRIKHADKSSHPDFPGLAFRASVWSSHAYPVQFKQIATVLPVDMCCSK